MGQSVYELPILCINYESTGIFSNLFFHPGPDWLSSIIANKEFWWRSEIESHYENTFLALDCEMSSCWQQLVAHL